jgi:predicted aspartyl protease
MISRPPVYVATLFMLSLFAPVLLGQEAAKPETSPLIKARALYRAGKLDEALAAYQAIIASDPKSGDAYAGEARVLLKKEKIADAEAAARKGIELDPKSDDAHVALGEVDFRKAFIAEAQQEFVEGLKINDRNARALLGRARIFRSISLYKHAHDFIVLAHQYDPTDPEIQRFWLSTLSSAQEISELERYLSGVHNDDADELGNMMSYLALLKERNKEPQKRCQLVSHPEQATIPLEKFMDGPNRYFGIGMKVAVNGRKTYLQVDTGASGILLSPKFAEKSGITPLVHAKMGGVGDKGPVDSYVGMADSIHIGDLEFQNCMVEVSEKKTALESNGLIGADILDKYLVTLDIPNSKMQLTALPKRPDQRTSSPKPAEPEILESDSITNDSSPQDRYIDPSMKDFSQVFRFGHMLLIPTSVGTSTPRLFLIDTGATNNLISPEAAREVTKVNGDNYTRVTGISGNVKQVYRADKAQLRFSHYRQDNQDILAFDLSSISKHTGTEVSGALGFTLLQMMKITIDYRDGLVDFQYSGPTVRR